MGRYQLPPSSSRKLKISSSLSHDRVQVLSHKSGTIFTSLIFTIFSFLKKWGTCSVIPVRSRHFIFLDFLWGEEGVAKFSIIFFCQFRGKMGLSSQRRDGGILFLFFEFAPAISGNACNPSFPPLHIFLGIGHLKKRNSRPLQKNGFLKKKRE